MPKDWTFSDESPESRSAPATSGGYLLSPDVTDPLRTMVLVDPANGHHVETITGGIAFQTIETEGGISHLRRADGTQLEQYPGIHGGFSFVPGSGAYGRCTIDGLVVTFKTRPEDPAYSYTVVRLP